MVEKISRRDFIGSTLAAGALLAAGGGATAGVMAKESADSPKARYALIIDTTRCAGCGACADACHQRN